MNEQEICKEITNLHDNILAAGIVERQQLVGRYIKDDMPQPDEERLRLIFARPEIVFSILNTNEDYFGAVRYLIICSEKFDFIAFRYGADSESRIFYVRTKRNYRAEAILQKIYDYLERRAKGLRLER
jgi:hypothetical protein